MQEPLQIAEGYVNAMARTLAGHAQEGFRAAGPGAVMVTLDMRGRVVKAPVYATEGQAVEQLPSYDPLRTATVVVRMERGGREAARGVFTITHGAAHPPPGDPASLAGWVRYAVRQAPPWALRHGRGLIYLTVGAERPLRYLPLTPALQLLSDRGRAAIGGYDVQRECLILIDGNANGFGGLWRVPLETP